MDKTIVVTQAFCRAELLNYCLSEFYQLQCGHLEHWILIKNYPVNEKKNKELLLAVADLYCCKVFECDEEHVGLHQGLNQFLEEVPQDAGTVMINFEQDALLKPFSTGFDVALSDVAHDIKSDVPILSLWNRNIDATMKGKSITPIQSRGESIYIHDKTLEVYSVAAYSLDFVKSCGGFQEPCSNYGYLEWFFAEKLAERGKNLGFLVDYEERYEDLNALIDPEYEQYKNAHARAEHRFNGSFRDFMKEFYPEKLK
jgi:hypothetical protein